MAVRWKYLYSSSVGLHIIALILIRRYLFCFARQLNLIRQYLFWFYFLGYERNIESKNLPDKVANLGIFTRWLASSGCLPHTSSVWPWSGAPKVRLYDTFMSGLRQHKAKTTVPTKKLKASFKAYSSNFSHGIKLFSTYPYVAKDMGNSLESCLEFMHVISKLSLVFGNSHEFGKKTTCIKFMF